MKLQLALLALVLTLPDDARTQQKGRARDLGIPLDGVPGPLNAITDVAGVEVGHATIISGSGASRKRLAYGSKPILPQMRDVWPAVEPAGATASTTVSAFAGGSGESESTCEASRGKNVKSPSLSCRGSLAPSGVCNHGDPRSTR